MAEGGSSPPFASFSASVGRHRGPVSRIVSRCIPHYVLRWVAVHQRAQVHRMLHAAHLMLNGEQHLASVGIDEVLKTILMLIAFLKDQTFFLQAAMGA